MNGFGRPDRSARDTAEALGRLDDADARELAKLRAENAALQADVSDLKKAVESLSSSLARRISALENRSSVSQDSARPDFVPAHLARPVTIVIPIYNAFWDVARCVRSVLKHRPPKGCRLILVNDGSTETGLGRFLHAVAARCDGVTLIENSSNMGFVRTANRGMRAAGTDDVLLLNSDTIVTKEFVEHLQQCVLGDEETGIACPLTNNGTICAIPNWLEDNPLPSHLSVEEIAEALSRGSLRMHPPLVTAVGFCMYMRAEVLREVGYFDETAFGRGYGEENDLCERAKKRGFQIRLCDDLFVYHRGGASFGDESALLTERNLRVLESRHPGYHAAVQRFIEVNPLRLVQANAQLQMQRQTAAEAKTVLILIHSPIFSVSGGTEFHVLDVVRAMALPRVVIAYPHHDVLVAAEVCHGCVEERTMYSFPLSKAPARFLRRDEVIEERLAWLLRAFHVRAVHIHHLMHWPIGLWRVLVEAGVPYVVTCHDYYAVCPSHDLYNLGGKALCDARGARCPDAQCLESRHAAVSASPPRDFAVLLEEHRAEFADLLANATRVVCPSNAAKEIVDSRYPLGERAMVIPHGYDAEAPSSPRPPRSPGRLRVGFLGAISNPIKGSHNYLELLSALRSEDVDWHAFGCVDASGFGRKLEALHLRGRLHRHGAYRREEICALLRANDIDLCVLLAPWAETFSYTLSESLCAGVPVLVSDIGAPAERIAGTRLGIVVRSVGEAAERLRRFARDPGTLDDMRAAAGAYAHKTVAENASEYALLYDGFPAPRSLEVEKEDGAEFGRSLAEAFLRGRSLPDANATNGAPAAPAYQRSWWYPYFLKIKPLVPPELRQLGRRQLVAQELDSTRSSPTAGNGSPPTGVVGALRGLWRGARQRAKAQLGLDRKLGDLFGSRPLELPFAGSDVRWTPNKHVRLIQEKESSTLFEALGSDPCFVLDGPFPTRPIRRIDLRLKLGSSVSKTFAQIFWTHDPEEDFSEAKSIRVPIVEKTKDWRTITIDLATSPRRDAWLMGPQVARLRFDPISVPGQVELEALVLHKS